MNATFPCPHCRTAVAQGARRCWLCGGPLDPNAAAQGTPVVQDKTWLVVVILASVVLLLIGVQLALIAPGLLVIYAVLILPVCVTLARIAWVGRLDFWRSAAASERAAIPTPPGANPHVAPGATPGTEPYPRTIEASPGPQLIGIDSGISDDPSGKILSGIAIAVAVFLGIVALVVVLFVAAVVVFAIICFGSLP